MEYTKEQIEKLPKWAQVEIQRLKSQNEYLNKKLSEFNGESETNTYIADGFSERPLPKNSCIIFKTGLNNLNSVRVYVNTHGFIDINCDSRKGDRLVLLPSAANSFYIDFID